MAYDLTFKGLLGSVGHTPLIRIPLPVKPTVLAKLEYVNPSGSIKDRAALYMVEEAERLGQLKPGGTIVEASSGNQGIALAMIGAIKRYRVIITVPDRTAAEKISILRAYGAEVHVCPNTAAHDDPKGYHARAEALLHEIPGAFMPNQYYSISNAQAHYHATGPEIWHQTQGSVTHFIAGAGTCGTISGVGQYLKEHKPSVHIIGVDAEHSLYSGAKPQPYAVEGLGIDVISDTFNQAVVDQIIPISDKEAFAMTRRVAQDYGLLVGISSGAVMHVALNYAQNLSKDDVVVLILADSGRSYLSKVFMSQGA